MFYEVIPGRKVGVDALTYEYDGSLPSGTLVEIPIGRTKAAGVIRKKVAQPSFACKKITRILYSKSLPKHLMDLLTWMSEYYMAPTSSVLGMILPNGILKRRRKTEHLFGNIDKSGVEQGEENLANVESKIKLNTTQKNALQGLQKAPGATKLLFGVTGSGKTNVYLSEAASVLKKQKSVVLLVPEIALTGQLVQVFQSCFGDRVIVIHSRLTEAERHLIFEQILESTKPCIVVGPRSALFAPLSNLGLIIIDEEHEGTYYQENSPKYSAIRTASFIAKNLGIPCILGSATPNIVDYYVANKNNRVVTMAKKAKSTAIKPEIRIIDFKDRGLFSSNRYFSTPLLQSISKNLKQGYQTLLFHNRRGSAPLTICEKCGLEIVCPNCCLPLTLHADSYELVCHTCGFKMAVPSSCPKCGALGLIHKGFGTKLLETEIRKLFPQANVRRFDSNTDKREGLDAVYDSVKNGETDILIGTQTIAKGLDLPKLATVGVVQADAGLSLPDFAAEERTFQLLTQVIGRVGRGHIDAAEVIIQTFRPEHPVINLAAKEDYLGFLNYQLKKRRESGFPPFRYVMRVDVTMKTEATAIRKIRTAVRNFSSDRRLLISPPMPAFHERTSRGYTWQVVVRSRSRSALIEACKGLDQNFHVSIDPPGLL